MSGLAWLKRSRRATIVALAVALSIVTGGAALAASSGLTFVPHKADQITNLGVLETQIKNYYGTPTAATGPTNCDENLVSPANSNYSREARAVAAAGERWLKSQLNWWARSYNHKSYHHKTSAMPAIVLDVDDTTVTTWNYELCSNWDYNPTANAVFVGLTGDPAVFTGNLFPATPGMVSMVTWAANHGYAVFFITGRGSAQYQATLANLVSDTYAGYADLPAPDVDAGYPAPTTIDRTGTGDIGPGLFTKPDVADYPLYLQTACASDPGGKCTTIHYKSATRAYIESQGYDIVASFGDQYSDLKGGYADKTFKMPNPNYYLP